MRKYTPNFIPSKAEEQHDWVVYRDVRIPVRDGIEISTNIYFPATNGEVDFSKKYPVIMNRTGYMGKNGEDYFYPAGMQYYALELGYVVINSGSRGTFKSGGDKMRPLMDEGWSEHPDGVDVTNWIARQPWCDGRIATTGMSWMGNTQYSLWLADEVPESLVTSAIANPAMNSIDGGWVYKDEFLDQGCCEIWALLNIQDQINTGRFPADVVEQIKKDDIELGNARTDPYAFRVLNIAELQMNYGLENIPVIKHVPFYRKWLENRDNPDFFFYNDIRTRRHDIKKPNLFIGSWYDLFNNNTLYGYEHMVEEAPSKEIAEAHRLIVGPWPHTGIAPMLRQYPASNIDMRMMNMEWIQQQVNGVKSEYFEDNPVTLFDVGACKWRSEKSWPIPDAEAKKYYLHSMGPANTMLGMGFLSEELPGTDEAPDNYMYDPANPIMNPGGHSLVGGQCDQRFVEMRPDVLCYTTGILAEDVDVTGYVRATLFAVTSAEDTDFIMKLVDVCPDGNCYNVLTGGRRGRYLKNGRSNPTPLIPGEINTYQIELHAICCTFQKGHRIRVEICSSDALNFDINPNAFIDLNKAKKEDYVVAAQTIYHDAEHPSFIELPVIPENHAYNWFEEWPFDSALTGWDYAMTTIAPPAVTPPAEKDRTDLPSTTPQKPMEKTEVSTSDNAIKF